MSLDVVLMLQDTLQKKGAFGGAGTSRLVSVKLKLNLSGQKTGVPSTDGHHA
jgi:hypothetical protein